MDKEKVVKYFSDNAASWIDEAYGYGDYTYPVGLHRMRIVIEILKDTFGAKGIELVDLGSGRGDLCMSVARFGHSATGIDQSDEMIEIAKKELKLLPEDIAARVSFKHGSLDQVEDFLPVSACDVVTAMGFIGYLPDDEALFTVAKRLLRPGGRLIVSCRNRLFNLTGGSKFMTGEIQNGTALPLIDELNDLYQQIPQKEAALFVQNLKDTVGQLSSAQGEAVFQAGSVDEQKKSAPEFTFSMEARQHTPKQLITGATKHGFMQKALYGVHPHLLPPRLNTLLPPQLFNRLSDCLCALEKLPVSLAWSSVFIAVFESE